MKLRERLARVPWDVWLGYAAFVCFVCWFGFAVLAAPALVVGLLGLLFLPLFWMLALFLAVRTAILPGRLARIVPLGLTSACALALCSGPMHVAVDVQVLLRVYAAGGPSQLNSWAQQAMLDHPDGRGGKHEYLEGEDVPEGVRKHLGGWVAVGGTLWSDQTQLRIELGGGFFHYGLLVYPTELAPPAEWWQTILGWPPEVVIYHED
jgi:hypothetical protein